ncbi:MAG: GAF domain-containing protein [Candidatus Omnitrophica bacterium]|nr:GAF domain-containing protein [Candidatus Omnitrophota bacterium]
MPQSRTDSCVEEWARVQDLVADCLKIGIRTYRSQSGAVGEPARPAHFCHILLPESSIARTRCAGCVQHTPAESLTSFPEEGVVCHAGLYNFILPVDDWQIIVGPCSVGRKPNAQEAQRMAQELAVHAPSFQASRDQIKLFSFSAVQSVVRLLHMTSRMILKERNGMTRRDRPLKELLSAFLDAILFATHADTGSVMLWDEGTGYLSLQEERGLSRDISRRTRLRKGEGIAGLVLEEGRPLLLDDGASLGRVVRDRMTRPTVKSALISPIAVGDRVVGVVNITSFREGVHFSTETANMVHQLVRLAGITLAFETDRLAPEGRAQNPPEPV